ncbi:hypothetical protein [Crocosphaera sp.]|nr:hypothetical protein [Crocosphaera sp.]
MKTIKIPNNTRQDLLKELAEPKNFSFSCPQCAKPFAQLCKRNINSDSK